MAKERKETEVTWYLDGQKIGETQIISNDDISTSPQIVDVSDDGYMTRQDALDAFIYSQPVNTTAKKIDWQKLGINSIGKQLKGKFVVKQNDKFYNSDKQLVKNPGDARLFDHINDALNYADTINGETMVDML